MVAVGRALEGERPMRGLFGFVGMTVGGAIGWWLGEYVGLFTAVVISGSRYRRRVVLWPAVRRVPAVRRCR